MCKVMNCPQRHDFHFCRNCKNINSDHFSSKCTLKPQNNNDCSVRCKADNCYQRHEKHYCRVCHNKNSNHLAQQCPIGVKLYHGTKLQYAKLIIQNGFRISQNGRMGPGVYLTPDWNVAANAAKRLSNCTQFAVIQCILDQSNQHVEEGLHPPWHRVANNQFIQYVVKENFIHRIKITKIHIL